MARRVITATYRVQLSRDMPFAAIRTIVPYLHQLGVSHVYLSPVLAARSGSAHGYDVVDPGRVNAELGGEDDLRALADDLHERGMGIILDIVPNHMAASAENGRWDHVLERGRGSRFAHWFDVDWDAPGARGKIVLPVLGDTLDAVLDRGEISLRFEPAGPRVGYFDRSMPLDPATLPRVLQLAHLDPAAVPAAQEWAAGTRGKDNLRALLGAQHYRVVHWRRARDLLNYRRFFDVNDLVALRMETDDVFRETHALILDWVRDGVVDGLRVDHVDGIRSPAWYLGTLRTAVDAARHAGAPERIPIFVEKILAAGETLPLDWPVDGTTGYDFLNESDELFVRLDGLRAIEAAYRGLRHNPSLDFRAVARAGKERAVRLPLNPDVARVARVAHAWRPSVAIADAAVAIAAYIVQLEVYRTYLVEPGLPSAADRRSITAALAAARDEPDVNPDALAVLDEAMLGAPTPGDLVRAELVARIEQTSGAAAAKGVEDTAFYNYVALASRNEVGSHPYSAPDDPGGQLHERNAERRRGWPRTMLAVGTHDTKRSADVRARLHALTATPAEWARSVARWRKLNRGRKRTVRGRPAPDTNTEYLYYQSLLGIWPASRKGRRVDDLPHADWLAAARERMGAYMMKAAREGKTSTAWTQVDAEFEAALQTFVRDTLTPEPDAPFLSDLARLAAGAGQIGLQISLARLLLQCTAPGTPDVYQGDELWNFTLVDPDNRRPVDFNRRMHLLAELDLAAHVRALFAGEREMPDDKTKLAVLAGLLRFRREHVALVAHGDYLPLPSVRDAGLFAFARHDASAACLTLARTSMAVPGADASDAPDAPDAPDPGVMLPRELAGAWTSVLTGRAVALARTEAGCTARVVDLVPAGQFGDLLLRTGS